MRESKASADVARSDDAGHALALPSPSYLSAKPESAARLLHGYQESRPKIKDDVGTGPPFEEVERLHCNWHWQGRRWPAMHARTARVRMFRTCLWMREAAIRVRV